THSTITSRIVHLFKLQLLFRSECNFLHGSENEPSFLANKASLIITDMNIFDLLHSFNVALQLVLYQA
ncbi:hypothetical protein EAY39_26340, partial [Vibrio anguillarum]|nr:hypothetical protein [Vibrio anguillarum]